MAAYRPSQRLMAAADGNPPCVRSLCSCYLLIQDDAYCVKRCNMIEMNVILYRKSFFGNSVNVDITHPDSSLRYRRYINHLLTYLFGRSAITLGIGPHSCLLFLLC